MEYKKIANLHSLNPSMTKAIISVLSTERIIRKKLEEIIHICDFELGFSGNNPDNLIEYLENNKKQKHLLLMKPGHNLMEKCSPKDLRNITMIDVIFVGSDLPREFIGLLQESHVSGFINPDLLTEKNFKQLYKSIEELGFFANRYMPMQYWKDKPQHIFPRPTPNFTFGEHEILQLLCHNYSVLEICEHLNRSEAGIRSRITNLKKKLRAETIYEIIVITLANNWVVMSRKNVSSKSPYLKGFKDKD